MSQGTSGVWLKSELDLHALLEEEIDERYADVVEQVPAVVYIDLPDDEDTTLYVSAQVESIL